MNILSLFIHSHVPNTYCTVILCVCIFVQLLKCNICSHETFFPMFYYNYQVRVTSPTVDSEFDRHALHTADGVLHPAAVDVIVWHHDACDGQDLLVTWQEKTRVVGQSLPAFQPAIGGFSATVVSTVEYEGFSQLQYRWCCHVHMRSGHWNCDRKIFICTAFVFKLTLYI